MQLYLEGKGPIQLPSVNQPKGTGNLYGSLMIKPGPNEIPDAYWEAIKEHPGVKVYLKGVNGKQIKTNATRSGVSDPVDAPRPDTGLAGMTVEKASPHIEACTDPDVLATWRNTDRRKGIHELIDARLAELVDADMD